MLVCLRPRPLSPSPTGNDDSGVPPEGPSTSRISETRGVGDTGHTLRSVTNMQYGGPDHVGLLENAGNCHYAEGRARWDCKHAP